MNQACDGMVSLRGALVPVVDLGDYVGISSDAPQRNMMIVTEYNHHTQGFLVEAVDTILRVDWAQMRVRPGMLSNNLGGLVTAVTELEDGRLVMLLDVERILAETVKPDDSMLFSNIAPLDRQDLMVLYADDLSAARNQIQRTLDALGVRSTGRSMAVPPGTNCAALQTTRNVAAAGARFPAGDPDRRRSAGWMRTC